MALDKAFIATQEPVETRFTVSGDTDVYQQTEPEPELVTQVTGTQIAEEISKWQDNKTNWENKKYSESEIEKPPMPIGGSWVFNESKNIWEQAVTPPTKSPPDWWNSINPQNPESTTSQALNDPITFLKKYGLWVAIAALVAYILFKK